MRFLIMKIIKIFLIAFLLSSNAFAGSDGELNLSKKAKPTKDCFEKINRASFALNQGLDKAIFKPVASVYRKLPSPVKSGVGNTLDNLSNLVTIPNNLLQGEFAEAGVNTGRFLINTTVGILGLMDVAQHLGLNKMEREDYGQSLAKLGVGPGCYVVLPVLGPSTARDVVGSASNFMGGDAWYNVTVRNDTQYFKESDYYYSKLTEGVDFRAKNLESFDSLEKTSVDFYATVRSLYLQDRERKIKNLKERTETLDDSDWDSIDK